MGENRLKISDLSRDTDINRGTLTCLYNETATRVDLEVIEQLCDYLDIPVGELFKVQKRKWISLYNS
nr:helix-turn-helix transcriptional regulator [Photobacterium kishitanii]